MTKASLKSNDKKNIDLVLSPVKTQTPLTEADIHELVENSVYSDLFVVNGNIKNAIAELKSVLKPLQENHTGREIKYQILERRDATVAFEIDSDNMSASAEITTALGGKHFSAKEILDAAQAANVCKGFSKDQLVKIAERATKEPAGSIVKGEIARGKLPIDGKDAYIKHLVQSAQDRILRPKEREDGSVDMRDLGDIICVKIGDPLAKKIPHTDGIPGYTVTGEVLEPSPGNDIEMRIGDGTVLSEKNTSILVSTLVGLPRIIENGMEVDSVYHLKKVDVSTGHVKFKGSVIIDGDVGEGMKVTATGDISIGGFVESATLDAGRDITIGTGIIGKKQEVDALESSQVNLSVNIKAGGKVYAKYSQYADISCDSLRIENQIMHNIIIVDKTLWVGNKDKANGKLIAGYVSAGESVRAGTIGATAGGFTVITFTDKMNAYLDKIAEIDLSIKSESDQSLELRVAALKLKKLPKEKAKPEMLAKVVTTYKHHARKTADLLFEKESLEEVLQEYMNSVYVEANERVYHGVQIIVGDFQERTRREYGPSRFKYNKRQVHINPIV
ncbi:DUF342 domain-containing protein [Cognaticolwellia beringensis]|uniref:DUF342 domain-containing protein n=1 Tax=Cognaticolwellia beringensis TaxID=1967665 RepID=A0A222G5C1_9GAMM|nr:FapA family protein [Cognaticolwellia beringensis]ASP46980.1 DUF342 domain-containing protein [Cognaticolwellia beringensis]